MTGAVCVQIPEKNVHFIFKNDILLPNVESASKEGSSVLSSVLQYYYTSAPPFQCFISRLAVIQ